MHSNGLTQYAIAKASNAATCRKVCEVAAETAELLAISLVNEDERRAQDRYAVEMSRLAQDFAEEAHRWRELA